jgi:hypothetical protein
MSPNWSRRELLALLGASPLFAQGVSSRTVKAAPRSKPSGVPFLAQFTDIASAAGLTEPVIYGGVEHKTYIIETIGCGVAFFDYDNDGWLDIFLPSGSRLEGAPAEATNRLYKNNRDGTFRDVTEAAGLKRSGWFAGVTIADYDNDGFEDIFLTSYGDNILYHNNGDGSFTDVTGKAGLLQKKPADAISLGSGCTWIDYDRDGKLDLFVAHYADIDLAKTPKPGETSNCMWKGIPVICGPRGLTPSTLQLYHNNGDGTFTDVSGRAGIRNVSRGYAMTSVAADLDNDGWPDIFVACDSTPSMLFRNMHDGTFREEGLERGAALSEDGMEQAGMGVGAGDLSLTGNLDLFKTHFSDDTSVLYRNDGKGSFDDVTLRAGIGVETRYVGWGAGIADLDNDGVPDIFLVTGHVYPEIEKKLSNYPYKSPRLVFRNLGGGKFEELIEEAGPGVAALHSSRGCAFGDFDNDGDVDVLIMNMNEPPSLLRNDLKGSNQWLKVKLIGTKSNRSAIGTRVTAQYGGKSQIQEVTAQSSFYSVNDKRLHFGLGAAQSADLQIRWTNGLVERFPKVPANRLITIREGEGKYDAAVMQSRT